MRETFSQSMDPTTTSFTSRRGFFISRTTVALLFAFLLCSYIAVAVIFYSIADSSSQEFAGTVQNGCSSPHVDSHIQPEIRQLPVTTHPTGSNNSSNNLSSSAGAGAASAESSTGKNERITTNVRLPRSIVPSWYNIKLVPFLNENNFTFNGEVTIAVDVREDCNNITLHAAALTIHEVRVYRVAPDETLEDIKISRKSVDALRQFFIIETSEILHKSESLQIYIRYEGVLNDYLQGFYRSSYNVGKEKRYVCI